MPRLPWLGLPSLRWVGTPTAEHKPVEGLVLAGGGSRASFQLGALRYLYDHTDMHPTVMVGTSAGSILTAALSQHADRDDQAAAARSLEELWLAMRDPDQMFQPRPWFSRLQERSSDWMELMATESSRPEPRRTLPRLNVFGRSPEVPDDPEERAVEVSELTGQALTLKLAMEDPAPQTNGLSPSMVMPLLSMLPRLRSAGSDLSLILRGADASRSMYHPGALLTRLLDTDVFQSGAVALSGVTVRLATVALESGELRFMTETGDLVDRNNVPVPGPPHDLSLGVLASCSIPAVFPPVLIGDEWYVDGGIRENTPAEMAIGHLGVARCYVLVSSPTEKPRADSFESQSMLNVIMRTSEIMGDETERDEVAYARSAGALVIEPELFVHDSMTVEGGLLRINRDYGWLRAIEAHQELPESTSRLHRRIIERRLDAHRVEREYLTTSPLTAARQSEDTLRDLTRLKFRIRDDLAQLPAHQLPADAQEWWRSWETHAEPVPRRAAWLSPL